MHAEFENKKMNIEDIEKKINQKFINYDHFVDSKTSINQKYENEFFLETVKLDTLPEYIKMNEDKYKEWIVY